MPLQGGSKRRPCRGLRSSPTRTHSAGVEHARTERRSVMLIDRESWGSLKHSLDLTRRKLDASDIRPNAQMCQLLILGEDHRMALHPGVDPLALCRAVWRTYGCNRREGGSTIAMQLVRVLTGRFERSWHRKVDEMALAILTTRLVSRAELPAVYLSVGYYGWCQWQTKTRHSWQTKIQQFWREFVAPGSVPGCWPRWSCG